MKAIVSLATDLFRRGQIRLMDSLINKTDADFIGFNSVEQVAAPPHSNNPYAFKIYAIQAALNRGYRQILWLDASAYAVNPVQPIFDIIERDGYFLEEAGHWAGTWANDKALNYFGIDRDEAMTIPMFSAGWTGLNFEAEIAREFFARWKNAMLSGCFIGGWHNTEKTESQDERCKGHRHDMVCGSIIAHKLGMKYTTGGSFFQYGKVEDALNHPQIIFKAQGI